MRSPNSELVGRWLVVTGLSDVGCEGHGAACGVIFRAVDRQLCRWLIWARFWLDVGTGDVPFDSRRVRGGYRRDLQHHSPVRWAGVHGRCEHERAGEWQ